MSIENPSKWDQQADRNQERVRERAKVLLNDSSYNWLRTNSARRILAVLYVVVVAALVTLWAQSWTFAALLAMAVWGVALLGLRISVRTQADLPDYALDERQRAERDRTYLDAYRIVGGVAIIGAAVALFVVASRDRDGAGLISLDYGGVSALFWGTLATLVGLPSLVMAWTQHE
jgi:hypothetical protein